MPRHPTVASTRRPRGTPAALVLALAVIACAAGGCGSSHAGGTSVDPATAVPSSAALYAGATVRPTGSLKASASAAGRGLTRQADPYLRLLGALQTPGSPTLDFDKDVAPWLGERAGVYLSSSAGSAEAGVSRLLTLLQQGLLGSTSASPSFPFATSGVQGAIVLDTSDADKARSFLESQAKHAGAHAAVYRGVSYRATTSGVCFGVVDRLAVIGSEAGLHGVVDTTLGGPPLIHATGYSKLLASAPSDALAHLYANAGAFRSSAGEAPKGGLGGVLSLLAGGSLVNVSLIPSSNSIALDADALNAESGILSSSAEAARAAGELPGESWLAVGLGNVGSTLSADLKALDSVVSLGSSIGGSGSEEQSGGLSVKGLLGGILAPLRTLGSGGAQARHDFTSWMGSGALFAAGSGLLELKGGVVIESKNAALSRAAVGKLAAKLRQGGSSVQSATIPGTEAAVAARLSGLPVVLDIADGRDASGNSKFVIGIGEASVEAALSPSSTLSAAASRRTAATALGEGIQPSVTVDFPTLLSLLEGVGLTEDPTIAPFLPYVHELTTLAAGGKSLGGDVERFRLVLGLQPSG